MATPSCQIEFSHERHSPLPSPRGFQERMGHNLWSVESEKIVICYLHMQMLIMYVQRNQNEQEEVSKEKKKKIRFGRGERELIRLSWYKKVLKILIW